MKKCVPSVRWGMFLYGMCLRRSISRHTIAAAALASAFWGAQGVLAQEQGSIKSAAANSAAVSSGELSSKKSSSDESSSTNSSSLASSSTAGALQMVLALLPEADSSEGSALRIVGSNAHQFKQLILPELFTLVRDGGIQLSAYRRLRYPVGDDAAWAVASPEQKITLDADGAPIFGNARFRRGFPFGSVDEIASKGEALAGNEVLWNFATRRWSYPVMKSSFDISVVREQRLERRLQGSLTRWHPHEEGEAAAAQVFREFIQMTSPEVVADYRFLSFRFLGNEEDLLWMYSPALKQVRQLTGPNRSDPLFRTGVSLDDLFLWSTKPETVGARLDKGITAFVPFMGLDLAKLSEPTGNDPCKEISIEPPLSASAAEGGAAALFPQEGAELFFPEGTVVVPRELVRVTLNPKDPFGQNGRVVLYLDKQLQIPVAKVVFDRSGQLWKIALAGLGISASENETRREPFLRFVVVSDRKSHTVTTLDFTSTALCSAVPDSLPREFFDPARLAPPAAVAPATAGAGPSSGARN